MDDVYVVECATTGDKGFPYNKVVQIAICKMHKDGEDYDTIYDSFISVDPLDIGKEGLDHLQSHYGITAETLYAAPDEEYVIKEVFSKLSGTECTSFNVNHTFGKFLCVEPWDLNMELTMLPSISSRLDLEFSKDIQVAYEHYAPGNPMQITGRTAMDRCLMSLSLMMLLRRNDML